MKLQGSDPHADSTVLVLAAVAGIGLSASDDATAQPYPSQVIKLIVPFGAGGQPDTIARLIGQQLSARVGPVVIENRSGAGGILGTQAAAGAAPDGHTLVLGTIGSLAIGPAMLKTPGYDALKSFAPVAMVSNAPFVLVVGPDVPARTVHELVAHAKANPGKLNFGAVNASPPHLACDLFRRATAIDIVRVPYKGGQNIADLLGGHTQMLCEATTVLFPLIQSGKAKPLAVMTVDRLPELPDVPAAVEIGLPDLLVSVWAGILVPAGTPESIIDRLNIAINEGLKSPELQASLAKLGTKPTIGTPQDFAAFIAAEARRWADVVHQSGIKLD